MALLAFPVQDFVLVVASLCFLYITSYNMIVPGLMLAALCTAYLVFRAWREAKQVHPFDKHVLITGCDTGFGNRFAQLLDRKGFHVFATCYSDKSEGAIHLKGTGSQRMRVLQLDVTSQDSVETCLMRVKEICGEKGLWAVVNNAGIQLSIDVELLDMETFYRICEVNMFGLVRVCKAFLPLVRRQKGRIVNVTSVRGLVAFPIASAYCMSKFGAEGFTDSLRLEMRRFEVRVILVQPGMYGLATGLNSPENVEIGRRSLQKLISNASDEIKKAYGEEYLATFPARLNPTTHPCTDETLRGVLESLELAVCSLHPRIRYLSGSTSRWFDTSVLLVRLRRFLPASVMDPLLLWFRPLRKESFLSVQEGTLDTTLSNK